MMQRIFTIGWFGFLQLMRSRIYLNLLVAGVFLVGASYVVDELSGGLAGRVTVDLGLALCSLVTATLAGVTAILGVTRQMETKEIHLLLARPIPRAEFVVGRFITSAALVLVSNLLFGCLLGGMTTLMGTEGGARVVAASLFVSFEGFIVIGIALFFGVKSSSTMSAVFTMTLFLLGRLTLPLLELIEKGKFTGAVAHVVNGVYTALPHFFSFDLTDWARTGKGLALGDVAQAAGYGLLYTAAFIVLASVRLERRDL